MSGKDVADLHIGFEKVTGAFHSAGSCELGLLSHSRKTTANEGLAMVDFDGWD